MNSKKIKILLIAIFSSGCIFVVQNFAQAAALEYKLLESFPGFYSGNSVMTDFPGLILAFYKFGIWTVGIAGLFMLVIGGFMYMSSAGNTATITSARKIIADALLGIAAAMGAYLVLYVINPDLTKISIAFITPINVDEELSLPDDRSVTDADIGSMSTGTTSGGCMDVVKAAMGQTSWIYNQDFRGKTLEGVRYTDCSDFVRSAYRTARCTVPGSTTWDMYPKAKRFSNASELKAGDAVVNKRGGHIVLCINDGCTQVIHSPNKKAKYVKVAAGSWVTGKSKTATGGDWTNALAIKASDFCKQTCPLP